MKRNSPLTGDAEGDKLVLSNLSGRWPLTQTAQNMKAISLFARLRQSFSKALGVALLMANATLMLGQGTVTLNAHPYFSGPDYVELGMWFQLIIPPGTSGRDVMGIVSADNPFMIWFRQRNPSDYVSLHLTNGSTFGLTSVWLADPSETSPARVSISFIGSLVGGSTVTNTFVTLGSGKYAFQNYTFNPDFASGLLSVQIDASRWAMDNLVFSIPEPGSGALLVLALVPLALRKRPERSRRRT